MLYHLALRKQVDIVSYSRGFTHIMRHHDTGQSERIIQLSNQFYQHTLGNRVLPCERFVVHMNAYVVFILFRHQWSC